MNRAEANSLEDERKEIAKIAEKPITLSIEADSETLTKLFTGLAYNKEDLLKGAKNLLPQYGFGYEQFQLFENIEEIQKLEISESKVTFCIYEKSASRWVLFCILQTRNGEKKILYKDSSGCEMSQDLENVLRKKIQNVDILVNSQKDQEEDEDCNYGPICLRNLAIVLNGAKEDLKKLAKKFRQMRFCQSFDLNKDKFDNVKNLALELAEHQNFKKELKKFVDNLPIELISGVLVEYNRFADEEMKKENPDYEKIEVMRKNCLTEEVLDKIRKSCNAHKNKDGQVYTLEIERKFPEDMKNLQNIFYLLSKTEVDDHLFQALENISEILGIDKKKMKLFYCSGMNNKLKKNEEKQEVKDFETILKKLPEMKKHQPDPCTPLDQLLEEITLGMDQDESSPLQDTEGDKKQLEDKYHLVKNAYEKWKECGIEEIKKWAIETKNHLGNSNVEICEAIAIMDRAFNLLTGGYNFRDTQILAVLIFLHNQEKKGRLCQIQTGEGKTNIVSLLAVIKVLQGHKVDVITSNPLLASDGVKETEDFYSVFNLTVSTNNPDDKSGLGYTADILYGTISNFQFDFLKDTFEGYDIRKKRPFGQVILDEVDSMLVDNGGHIAKLASPYPGMESLKYIYIKIWQALYKAEESFVKETEEKIKEILANPNQEVAVAEYDKYILEVGQQERKLIKDKIKATNPTDVPLIPPHLKEYAESKVDVWIKNALHAKYNCHEHEQYRIITDDRGEKVITPVDYLNTGVTLKNTIWSNGLHQFVQLKHNLHLTFESLTSSFISNIGFIKQYDSRNISGLTGTLGSRAEQELLSQIYDVDYAKLPTYKEKKFEELPGLIVGDADWATRVTLEVLGKVDDGRAVLVICETEQDLMTIREKLEILKCGDFRVRVYANEDNAKETGEKVKIGDVILATNIAGRGTNFKTEKNLEENGGLHVCVGFLPCNLRVEGQAFGRTSRQGNKGTAQLVIRRSEVEELEILEEEPDFARIKKERDGLERKRLKEINDNLVKELDFKDKLFECFSDLYREFKHDKNKSIYVRNDLKEFWAFWLEKKNFTAKNIVKKPEEEFASFRKEAGIILGGSINHNPYYSVSLAEFYLGSDEETEAKKHLEHALKLGGKNCDLLAGAHLKLFEVAIAEGDQVKNRVNKAIGDLFFIKIKTNDGYKKAAERHLNQAKEAISKELSYFKNHFMVEESDADFEKILVTQEEDNSFLKHVYSRYNSLKLHEGNIEELLGNIAKFSGVDLAGKVATNLKDLEQGAGELSKTITDNELTELQSIGIDALYTLREVLDVPSVILETARYEVGAGIACLCLGLAFPPFFPACSQLAGNLISGAIMDVVMALLVEEKVDKKEYLKTKFISYGKSLLCLGISAAMQSVSLLNKAIGLCRKLSKALRASEKFKKVCEKLANIVDKLEKYLQNLLDKALKLQVQQSRSKLFVKFMKETTMKTVKSLKDQPIVKEFVLRKMLGDVYEEIVDTIMDKLKEPLKTSIRGKSGLVDKLRTSKVDDINSTVDEFIKSKKAKELFEKFSPKLQTLLKKKMSDSAAAVLIFSAKTGLDLQEFKRYATEFASELDEKLKRGECDNNVDEVIDDICTKVAEAMLDLLKGIFKGGIGVVDEVSKAEDGKEEPHAVLGLKAGASLQEVKKRFRVLALETHPDKNSKDEEATARFQRIREAYDNILAGKF